jgi:hypothetical protein
LDHEPLNISELDINVDPVGKHIRSESEVKNRSKERLSQAKDYIQKADEIEERIFETQPYILDYNSKLAEYKSQNEPRAELYAFADLKKANLGSTYLNGIYFELDNLVQQNKVKYGFDDGQAFNLNLEFQNWTDSNAKDLVQDCLKVVMDKKQTELSQQISHTNSYLEAAQLQKEREKQETVRTFDNVVDRYKSDPDSMKKLGLNEGMEVLAALSQFIYQFEKMNSKLEDSYWQTHLRGIVETFNRDPIASQYAPLFGQNKKLFVKDLINLALGENGQSEKPFKDLDPSGQNVLQSVTASVQASASKQVKQND